jgi:Flp pilus assembly protein TadG
MCLRFSPDGRNRPSMRCLRDKSGVGAIEFAVIAPLLILMLVGMSDLGLGIYANMQVDGAAQYGAQYALVNGYDPSAITSAVKTSTDLSPLTVTPSQFPGCAGSNGVMLQAMSGGVCGDGSNSGTFVRVSVTHSYTTLIPYPGMPSSFTLSSQSTVRLK